MHQDKRTRLSIYTNNALSSLYQAHLSQRKCVMNYRAVVNGAPRRMRNAYVINLFCALFSNFFHRLFAKKRRQKLEIAYFICRQLLCWLLLLLRCKLSRCLACCHS